MSFAGVVVTYNRKEELVKNINAVLDQKKPFDCFYIIDNCSTDGTYDFLEENGVFNHKNIKFIKLYDNIGGAGGFYTGLKKAYDDGYDYICLMDDDGRPINQDTFSILYEAAVKIHNENEKLMINSLVVCEESCNELSFGIGGMKTRSEIVEASTDGQYWGLINPFNGTLISRELIDEIGFVNKEFFIRGDEVDFQSRATKAGAYISTVVDSIYYHPSADLTPMRWRGETVYVGVCPPWKGYYLVRNYTYRIKRDSGYIAAVKEFIFQVYLTFKCNPKWKDCMWLMFKGFLDGMNGRLGKRIKPGQKK